MNIKLYFRQVREILRQDKLFSSLYIAGTAMAILMTMVVFIFNYIMVAPIYPEYERDKTMVIRSIIWKNKEKGITVASGSSLKAVNEWWYRLKNVETVSAIIPSWEDDYIQPYDGSEEYKVKTKYVDTAFFSLVSLKFVDGKPFSDSDFASGLNKVVICESLARRLYGTAEGATGKTFMMNYTEYRVAGVVKDASVLTEMSFSHVYLPYTIYRDIDGINDRYSDMGGSMNVYMKIKDHKQAEALKREVQTLADRYNSSHKESGDSITVNGPDMYWRSTFYQGRNDTGGTTLIVKWGLLILIFLIVPSLNLGSIVSGQMENRLTEFGISKAFGATRGTLLRRVLNENLIMTTLGGIVGLIATWIAIYVCRNWIFTIFNDMLELTFEGTDTIITPSMLFSPWIFLMAFMTCVLLNLMSALIPVWKVMRKDIVYSLNQKK